MDMEHELRALRNQLAEKSKHSLLLQKEVLLFLASFLLFVVFSCFFLFGCSIMLMYASCGGSIRSSWSVPQGAE